MSSSATVEGARRALSQFAAGVQLLKILDKRPAHESDVVENLVCTAARLAEEAASSGAAGGEVCFPRPCDAHGQCRLLAHGQACHLRDGCEHSCMLCCAVWTACCAASCFSVHPKADTPLQAKTVRDPQCNNNTHSTASPWPSP